MAQQPMDENELDFYRLLKRLNSPKGLTQDDKLTLDTLRDAIRKTRGSNRRASKRKSKTLGEKPSEERFPITRRTKNKWRRCRSIKGHGHCHWVRDFDETTRGNLGLFPLPKRPKRPSRMPARPNCPKIIERRDSTCMPEIKMFEYPSGYWVPLDQVRTWRPGQIQQVAPDADSVNPYYWAFPKRKHPLEIESKRHVKTWEEYYATLKAEQKIDPKDVTKKRNGRLNRIVSLWKGDITHLRVDAIVNAAKSSLLGGGGVDGAIHKAAGPGLRDECAALPFINKNEERCAVGEAKITLGHNLPAEYVIHTVGPQIATGVAPQQADEDKLKNCYKECLNLVKEHNLRTVAFPCISTGRYNFPKNAACEIALGITRKWLEKFENSAGVERVIFCVAKNTDLTDYEELMQKYFPAN